MPYIALTHRVHCDVIEILLKVDVIPDYMIVQSCLPQTLLENGSTFTLGQFVNSTTSGLKVARHSIKAEIKGCDSLRVVLVTYVEGKIT